MECKTIQKKLSAFRDKELNAEISREIEKHLESCYACKTVFLQLKDVDRFLDVQTEVPANPYFLTKVKAKIEETNSIRPAITGKLLFPAYIAAGLLFGAFLGITAGKAVMAPSPLQNSAELGNYYAKADVFNTLPKRSLSAGYAQYTQSQPKPVVEVK
jgi:anti-sigma factor RsiW